MKYESCLSIGAICNLCLKTHQHCLQLSILTTFKSENLNWVICQLQYTKTLQSFPKLGNGQCEKFNMTIHCEAKTRWSRRNPLWLSAGRPWHQDKPMQLAVCVQHCDQCQWCAWWTTAKVKPLSDQLAWMIPQNCDWKHRLWLPTNYFIT